MPLDAWAGVLASAAVRSAWESLLLATATVVLLRRLPGLSPRIAHRLRAAGFAVAAVLPWCPPHVGERLVSSALRGGGGLHSWSLRGAAHGLGVHAAAVGALPGAAMHTPLHLSPLWAQALCLLWAAASLAALVRLAAGMWSLHRLVASAEPADNDLATLYRRLVDADGGARRREQRARLLVADGLAAPSACGLFGACILLPRGLAQSLSEEELEWVLRHEAAHLRRRDDWWALAARLVRALMPLALGLVPLERGMGRAREMACDDAALRLGSAPEGRAVRYAACLARLADKAQAQPQHGLAPGLGGDGSQLAARVGHILSSGEALRKPARLRVACVAAAAAGVACTLLTVPSVLSFAPGAENTTMHLATAQPLPQLLAPQPSEVLASAAPRHLRWSVSPRKLARSAAKTATSPAMASASAPRMTAGRVAPSPVVNAQLADATPRGAATAGPHLAVGRAAGANASGSSMAPAAVLFWSGEPGTSEGHLVLLFMSPGGQAPGSDGPIVLLNI